MSGSIKRGTRIKLFHTPKTYEVKEVGVFTPKMTKRDELEAGDVGYVIANMKSSAEVKIGDTITDNANACPEPLWFPLWFPRLATYGNYPRASETRVWDGYYFYLSIGNL